MFSITSLALVAGLLAAEPVADDALKLEVRRLVKQLDADDLTQRESAEARLVEVGPAALDLLPKPSARASAEAKLRLARVEQRLQQRLAESAAQPSTVTLEANAMPLARVLAAMESQTGNKIVDHRAEFGQKVVDPPLTLHFDKTPFWQALDQTLDAAGLSIYPYGEQKAVYVVNRPAGETVRAEHVCYSGPFRFEAVAVIGQRNLRARSGDLLSVEVVVHWEPRLAPIMLRQPLGEIKATGDGGQPIAATATDGAIEMPGGQETIAEKLSLPLALPPRDIKRIARLEGKLHAVLPGKTAEFSFANLAGAKDIERREAGATVTLEKVRQNGDVWQVNMRLKFDEAGDALATHRSWVYENPAYLEAEDGTRIDFGALETTRQTANEVGISYGFLLDGPPDKMKFVYKTPTLLIDKPFDYELKNLDLP